MECLMSCCRISFKNWISVSLQCPFFSSLTFFRDRLIVSPVLIFSWSGFAPWWAEEKCFLAVQMTSFPTVFEVKRPFFFPFPVLWIFFGSFWIYFKKSSCDWSILGADICNLLDTHGFLFLKVLISTAYSVVYDPMSFELVLCWELLVPRLLYFISIL